jgi:hypothetical protein
LRYSCASRDPSVASEIKVFIRGNVEHGHGGRKSLDSECRRATSAAYKNVPGKYRGGREPDERRELDTQGGGAYGLAQRSSGNRKLR